MAFFCRCKCQPLGGNNQSVSWILVQQFLSIRFACDSHVDYLVHAWRVVPELREHIVDRVFALVAVKGPLRRLPPWVTLKQQLKLRYVCFWVAEGDGQDESVGGNGGFLEEDFELLEGDKDLCRTRIQEIDDLCPAFELPHVKVDCEFGEVLAQEDQGRFDVVGGDIEKTMAKVRNLV